MKKAQKLYGPSPVVIINVKSTPADQIKLNARKFFLRQLPFRRQELL